MTTARTLVGIGLAGLLALAFAGGCPPGTGGSGGTGGNGTTDPNASGGSGGGGGGGAGDAASRLQPTNLTYQGAFRLPDEYNWGARGLCFRPGSGNGTLLVTGFERPMDPAHPNEACWDPSWNCAAFYGELSIPTPVRAPNWQDLPVATVVRALTAFDGGLAATVQRENVFISDIEYVPRRGTQTQDKIYGSLVAWYAEGDFGENTFPTIWFANLDGTAPRGMFYVGQPVTPIHGRKMGAYLFTVPTWYADQYLGGRTLVTGRSRGTPLDAAESLTTRGGSQGPTLIAFRPWDSENPTGNLDALPILYYRVSFPGCGGPNVGSPSQCDFPNFTMCDEWEGAAFVDNGTLRAILLLGYKGLGANCYDEPPVTCNDPCSDAHGYHCYPYERQVIFYDVYALGQSALGNRDPWTVIPYATWRPAEFYLQGNPCTNAGGMTYDSTGRRLFMVERGLDSADTNAVVVHVYTL